MILCLTCLIVKQVLFRSTRSYVRDVSGQCWPAAPTVQGEAGGYHQARVSSSLAVHHVFLSPHSALALLCQTREKSLLRFLKDSPATSLPPPPRFVLLA